jgi:hypothetical protein
MTEPSLSSGEVRAKERARRFAIPMALSYRPHLEKRWYSGQTVNISRSGVLFRAEFPLEPATPVQMRVVFPAEVFQEGPVEVLCRGTVVRVESPSGNESLPSLATTISDYRLVRR